VQVGALESRPLFPKQY